MHNLLTTVLLLVAASGNAATSQYPNALPDAGRASGDNNIQQAWFGNATSRYRHAVLGDSIEAQTLYVQLPNTNNCALEVTLLEQSVFEDITPRLADVTGDGRDNIIAIESHRDKGASLAIYDVIDGKLKKVAATPYIATRYRWLAPIGTADFNADNIVDVAYVETPHLAGVIRVWSFADAKPRLIASKPGYSNHRIGQNYLTGGIRTCDGRTQMILPDVNWANTTAVTVTVNTILSEVVASDTSLTTVNRHLQCE